MKDKHEFKMGSYFPMHPKYLFQIIPRNFKECQRGGGIIKWWRGRDANFLNIKIVLCTCFTQKAAVKCGALLASIKHVSSHHETHQIIIPYNGKSWVPKSAFCFQFSFQYVTVGIWEIQPSGKLETEAGENLRNASWFLVHFKLQCLFR